MMDDNGNQDNTHIPQKSVPRGGLMGKAIDILRSRKSNNEKETVQGNFETMKKMDNIEAVVMAEENSKKQDSIILRDGIYTIRKNLETSTVKVDPALKALVDSVCHH